MAIFVKLYKMREKLNEESVLKVYGLFYIGFKDNNFYWQIIVINLRRLVFNIGVNAFRNSQKYYKVINLLNEIGINMFLNHLYFLNSNKICSTLSCFWFKQCWYLWLYCNSFNSLLIIIVFRLRWNNQRYKKSVRILCTNCP